MPVWQHTGCFVHHRLGLLDWMTEGWWCSSNRMFMCILRTRTHESTSVLTEQVFFFFRTGVRVRPGCTQRARGPTSRFPEARQRQPKSPSSTATAARIRVPQVLVKGKPNKAATKELCRESFTKGFEHFDLMKMRNSTRRKLVHNTDR